jgi:hypothetical protein
MKISHELPISLFPYSYEWNNFDYLLPCFVDKYPKYREYFEQAKKDGRFIIMDNSLFEGYNHTNQELIDKINEFTPNIFIVPDAWNDASKTLKNAKHWMNVLKPQIPETTNLMAVLQGNTLHELLTSYQTLVDLGYTHIAFNHSSNAYYDMFPTSLPLIAQTLGRKGLINDLEAKNILVKSNYHHLLGASNPIEFSWYRDKPYIKSGDTSAPIINGALGIRIDKVKDYEKPIEKLEHFMEMDLSGQIEDITFNVQKFKEYIND